MVNLFYRRIYNLKNNEKKVISFFISFYIIGLAGLIIPYSKKFFIKLTPLALMLSFLAVMFFHRSKPDKKTIMVFSGIFVTGFLIEMIGVNTGTIFGDYYYGKGLGPKLWNTPLLIGINWLLLVYLSSNIISRTGFISILWAPMAATVMLIYDLLLEQVAPQFDMWYWYNKTVPLKNYIAWFMIALILLIIIKRFKINTGNKIAPVILVCHTVFFIILIAFYNITL